MIKKYKPLLVIFTGASNSGGRALNSEASLIEKEINPKLKFLNNSTLFFEDWNILNSSKGHFGFDGTPQIGLMHGWDLEISNLTKTNYFKGREVYLVKTGQGGSRIGQWGAGSNYETIFNTRVNAAKNIINKPHDTIILYSLSVLDAIVGLDANTWKQLTIDRINSIRTLCPKSAINLVLIESPVSGLQLDYNPKMFEIANEIKGVYVTSTLGLTLNANDTLHWNYSSMKILSKKLLDTFKL